MPYLCPCGTSLDLARILDGLPRDGTGSNVRLGAKCPDCSETIEVRLDHGGFVVGYSYFGGSLRFEPIQRVRVRGGQADRATGFRTMGRDR